MEKGRAVSATDVLLLNIHVEENRSSCNCFVRECASSHYYNNYFCKDRSLSSMPRETLGIKILKQLEQRKKWPVEFHITYRWSALLFARSSLTRRWTFLVKLISLPSAASAWYPHPSLLNSKLLSKEAERLLGIYIPCVQQKLSTIFYPPFFSTRLDREFSWYKDREKSTVCNIPRAYQKLRLITDKGEKRNSLGRCHFLAACQALCTDQFSLPTIRSKGTFST